MSFKERIYSVLLVSSAPKITAALQGMLPSSHYEPVTVATSASAARKMLIENEYDIIVVNSPLSDEFGTRFTLEVREHKSSEVLLITSADQYDETFNRVMENGIVVVSRPMSAPMFKQSLRTLCTMCERMRSMQKKQTSIEEKMAEIRVVNHAKWLLIEYLSMSESDAQHYIEKQAMNSRISKKKLAEEIIKAYE